MIERLRDALAPPKTAKRAKAETGYRRLLRWAALPVTDRRWAAPLAAVALGFGLFVGVAIGPGAAGTFAGGIPQIIEIPGFGEDGGGGEEAREGAGEEPASASASSFGGENEEETFAPLIGGEGSAFVPAVEEPPPAADPAPEKEARQPKPEAEELSGTVIHLNPAAGSYTVAEAGGVMSAVHAGKLPQAGTEVTVPIRTLSNGTLAEVGKRRGGGEQTRATLAGIVTAVDSDAGALAYAVSNRGSSVLVHVRPDPSGATPALPALGSYVTVEADVEAPPPPVVPEAAPVEPESLVEPGCAPDPASPPPTAEQDSVLWQREASGGGAPFTHADFAGILTAVCVDTAQLLVSADDVREDGRDLLFAVPPRIDLTKVEPGQSVLLGADIGADGSLSLTGLASDERLAGAEDAKATQGDLVPEKPKGKG